MEKSESAIDIVIKATSVADTPAFSEHKCRKGDRYWNDEEHERFVKAVRLHGKNWGEITKCVGTRSRQSVYSHAQKFRKRVQRDPNVEGADCIEILEAQDSQS